MAPPAARIRTKLILVGRAVSCIERLFLSHVGIVAHHGLEFVFFAYPPGDRRSIQMRREHPPHRGSGAARDGAGAKSEAAASDIAKLRYSNLASWPEANAHPPMVLPSPENNHGERWVSSL